MLEGFQQLIGADLQPKDLTFFQVSLRGVIVFIASLIMVRLSNRRFYSKKSAFDVILSFILASMLARAVNGSAPFFATLGGGFVLIGLHRLLAAIAFRVHWFGLLVKGPEDVLIEEGRIKEKAMRKSNISEEDLLEDLRLNGQVENPGEIKIARLERNGQISVVLRKS